MGDELLISYGAADQRVSIARANLPALLDHIHRFDAQGLQAK